MKTLQLKPKPGLKVLWPADRRELKPEGETVPDTAYWRRRLRCGDVVESGGKGKRKE